MKSWWRAGGVRAGLALSLVFAMCASSVAQAVEAVAPTSTYIVTVDGDFNDVVRGQLRDAGITIDDEFEYAFDGFVVDLAAHQLPYVQSLEYVKAVEEDSIVTIAATQTPTPSWGLDRIDQRERISGGGDGSYEYLSAGAGTTIYVGDTGVFPHQDLAGRLSSSGFTVYNDGRGTIDCNGHGTHVATTAAGSQYGIAKNATVVPMRVMGCNGRGNTSGIIASLDWILSPANPNPITQAVINLSIGGGRSDAFNDAIERVVNAGITAVVAAGNDYGDACTKSPASAVNAITVGATTISDAKSSFSNSGPCVDISAPGSSIAGGWFLSASSIRNLSGTSMASPHVAGAAAVYRGLYPTATVAQVTSALLSTATTGAITGLPLDTPNKLLYVSPTDSWPAYSAPTVEYKSLEAVTSTSAVVNIAVNPENLSTTARVEFSTSPTFASSVQTAAPTTPEFAGAEVISANVSLTSLSPNTRYSFRIRGENSAKTFVSPTYVFTTKANTSTAPTVSATGATLVTAYSAQLNGTVNPNGLETQIQIFYSPDSTFSTNVKTISGSVNSAWGSTAFNLNSTPINLASDTTYYYKVAAYNTAGYSQSTTSSFKTLVAPGIAPTITTVSLDGRMSTVSQTFTAVVNPQSQPTTVLFMYGRDTMFTLDGGTITLPVVTSETVTTVSVQVTGIIPGATYNFRFDAINDSGKTIGNTVLSSGEFIMPVIISQSQSSITDTGVRHSSLINAGGGNVQIAYMHSKTSTFDTFTVVDGSPLTVRSGFNTTVSASVTGLTPGTTYYYRTRLQGLSGPLFTQKYLYGATESFTTTGVAPVVAPTPSPSPTP
jgi:subtilisin family serine protease